MRWDLVDSGCGTAHYNMSLDGKLLEGLGDTAILHLYDWINPSATYGYFSDPSVYLNSKEAGVLGLELARRPTGGGIIFHLTDFAFSLLIPASHPAYSLNTLENYAFVNRLVIQAIQQLLGNGEEPSLLFNEPFSEIREAKYFCMAKPTRYDVMLHGRKVGGGAQRRTKRGFLHQGSICLALPPEAFLAKILSPGILQAMQKNAYALLPGAPTPSDIAEARHTLRQIFHSL